MLRTQTGDFLYLTAWMQARAADKWQITDSSFSSSSQSNKCDRWRQNTLSLHRMVNSKREEEWRTLTSQQYRPDEWALPFPQCGVGRLGKHADHLVLFTLYISATLACLRTSGNLQYSEYEVSFDYGVKGCQGRWKGKKYVTTIYWAVFLVGSS